MSVSYIAIPVFNKSSLLHFYRPGILKPWVEVIIQLVSPPCRGWWGPSLPRRPGAAFQHSILHRTTHLQSLSSTYSYRCPTQLSTIIASTTAVSSPSLTSVFHRLLQPSSSSSSLNSPPFSPSLKTSFHHPYPAPYPSSSSSSPLTHITRPSFHHFFTLHRVPHYPTLPPSTSSISFPTLLPPC